MAVDVVIQNGKVVSPTGITETGIAVKDGKIVALAPAEYLPEAVRTIDAKGKYVIPGLVDAHAHVDTGFMAKRETYDQCFENETKAAAVGGVTTIGTMPIVESILESFDTWVKAWEKNSFADSVFHFYTSSEKHLEELPKCPALGIVTPGEMGGYKGRQAEVTSGYVDDWRLFRYLEEVAKWGPPGRFMLHAENIDILIMIIERVIAEGRKDCAAWSDARPAWGEVDMIQTYMLLSKVTKCPIFIVHNTCKGSVDVIKKAKDEGIDVLAETCPQYLTMHKNSLPMYPPGANANPPLREEEDMEALWKGLRDGVIDTVGSDHAPWTKGDKGDNIIGSFIFLLPGNKL